jgi:hypothetical protein
MGILKMARGMDKVTSISKMGHSTKVNGKTTKWTAKVRSSGKMELITMVDGKMAKCTGTDNSNGQTKTSTWVTFSKTKNMASALLFGKMAENTSVSGKMESKMA